ncbi:flagellar biosynthesis regulator FlaF [Falsiphaeobacter marinintestinus]|uniref:flagellar biosynthesis regulator FlaF n=1 Tax=Falsiphaeobacter marinintestinus TaxID=1492905 RepID=UPI0011B3D091|nr:flagellar biosynthesis regulator FlaF [Phaeobacter marinintestinus]
MNALSQARRAYSAASAPTRTPKSIEYEAVARITARIQDAAQNGTAGFPALVAALHENVRLWTIFAADLADKDNGLPPDLRARLFYLSEFTRHHTSKVLARKDTVTPLLEINTAVLRGLRGEAT